MAPAATVGALTGTVLAGGRGRRMGTDKAALSVGGRTLLDRAAATLRLVCDEVVVVARPDQRIEASPASRVIRDRVAEGGPLAGLEAALAACPTDLLLVLPVDMPAVSPDLLRLLVGVARDDPTADAVVLRSPRGLEPFPMVVRRRSAGVAGRLLAIGERRLGAFLAELAVREVPEPSWRRLDPIGRWTLNLNRPADLPAVARAAGA